MTTRTVAAVDAGGTSTRALILTDEGTCIVEQRGGPGNPRSNPQAAETIAATVMDAATTAQTMPQLAVITVAGLVSMGGQFPAVQQALRARGFTGDVVLATDLHGMYFSAAHHPTGTVLICGTGTTAAAFTDGQLTAMRDGLGWLLGDNGGGYWIGREVLRAVAAALDGRGPATTMTQRVVGNLPTREAPPHSPELASLLAWCYAPERRPTDVAAHALAAIEHAADDEMARRICDQAASHILNTLASLPLRDGPVVVGGSVLSEGSPVGERVAAELGERMVRTRDGLVGAAALALRAIGVEQPPIDAIAASRRALPTSPRP